MKYTYHDGRGQVPDLRLNDGVRPLEVDVVKYGFGIQSVKLHAVGQVQAPTVGNVRDGDAILVPPQHELDVKLADHGLVGPAVTYVAERHTRQPELETVPLYAHANTATRRALVRRARLDHTDLGHLRRRVSERARGDETDEPRDLCEGFHGVALG